MEYDAILVLGGGVCEDGVITQISQDRARIAADSFFRGETNYIIVSGGTTSSSNISEAESICKYLVSIGVPEKVIIQERLSRSTIGNAYYTMKLVLEAMNLRNIALVTSEFHIKRALLTFKQILGKGYSIRPIAVKHEFKLKKEIAREKLLFVSQKSLVKAIEERKGIRLIDIARSLGFEE